MASKKKTQSRKRRASRPKGRPAKPKRKIGALGPSPAWLKLTPAERAYLKADIKAGMLGEEQERATGTVKIPGARAVYRGFTAKDGYDLRHIERWSAKQLQTARSYIARVRTLTAAPFTVKVPNSKKTRRAVREFTGQTLRRQKAYIFHTPSPQTQKIRVSHGKAELVTSLGKKSHTVQRLYLFKDYLHLLPKKEYTPEIRDFTDIKNVARRMLPLLPKRYGGDDARYILHTLVNGNIGVSFIHDRILERIERYHLEYDNNKNHEGFGEEVIGLYMIGTENQARQEANKRGEYRRFYRDSKKLRIKERSKVRKQKTKRGVKRGRK